MIDLRTDTITRPTEAMLAAMAEATQGDDSRDGDETVMKLEALAAERTGKAAGAYMPSGTMTNLVAVLAHAMDIDALREKIRPLTRNNLGTTLVCMETTHNQAGGAVLPLAHMKAVHTLAHENGVPVHTDGARLFNAAVALGVPASDIAQYTDSIGFCVSKGLSAPIGSVLCGSAAFIERARTFRRMVGGNMRQAGPLAAAGILALNTMVDRLKDDHASAKRLAVGLQKIDARLCNANDVETNLVRVDLAASKRSATEWSADMERKGLRVSPASATSLRFVTHRHAGNAEVDAAISAFAALWQQG